MSYTISTHNGSKVRRDHNIRNRKITDKEEHIDRNGHYEIWHDEKPQEAYKRIFGKSIEEYNARQERGDRRIQNYYQDVLKSAKQHPIYEMIVTIGSMDEKPLEMESRRIMKQFYEEWQQANPNLEVIGAYYHADEDGAPHMHLDYVPVAHGYQRGMETRTGLVKALEEQGFQKNGRETAQIQWERRENSRLEALCNARGLTIRHPREKDRKHIDTRTYKAQKRVSMLEGRQERLEDSTRRAEAMRTRVETEANQLNYNVTAYKRLEAQYEALKEFCKHNELKQGKYANMNAYEAFVKEQKKLTRKRDLDLER